MSFRDALIASSPVLLGMGQQLSGSNPTGIASGIAMMNAEAEKAKRKANIQGLLDSMNLSQQKRAFLEMLPFEQASPIIWDLMNPKPVAGRAPTEAELAARYAAGLGAPTGGGMPAGGGYSMGMPDDLGAPVAASGGLSLGAPAMESPAPATTAGLSFGNVQSRTPAAPVNPYVQLRGRIMADLPRIQNDALNGVPGAQKVLDQRLSQLKALEALAPAAPDMSEAEQEIARLQESGFSRTEAIKLKEGALQVIKDPVTGETILYDVLERRVIRPMVDDQPPAPPATPTPPGSSLSFGDQYSAARDSFGVEGAFKGAVNAAGDTLGLGTAFPEVRDTQSDFAVFQEKLLADISAGYNRQPPSWLLQRIDDLTPKAGTLTEGPDKAQSKMRALARDLSEERDETRRQLSSRALPPKTRVELETRLAGIEQALSRLGSALSSFRTGENAGTTSSGVKFRIVE